MTKVNFRVSVLITVKGTGMDAAQGAWFRSQIGPVNEALYLATGEQDKTHPHAAQATLTANLPKAPKLGLVSRRGVVPFRLGRQGPLAVSAH